MTESTPTADYKTAIQPYLRQAERGHQKGSPKFRGVSSVPRRLSLHGPAPPRAPQELWTPRLSIINRETPVHMSTSARFLLKSSKLSPKMAVDSPRGGVHTPFWPGTCVNFGLSLALQDVELCNCRIFWPFAGVVM